MGSAGPAEPCAEFRDCCVPAARRGVAFLYRQRQRGCCAALRRLHAKRSGCCATCVACGDAVSLLFQPCLHTNPAAHRWRPSNQQGCIQTPCDVPAPPALCCAPPRPAPQAVSTTIEQHDSALGSCAQCHVPFLCPSCHDVAPNLHKFRTAYQCQHALWTTLRPFMPQVAAAAGAAAGAAAPEGLMPGAGPYGGASARARVQAAGNSADTTAPLSS